MPRPRKIKTNPDMLNKSIQKVIDDRLNQVVDAMATTSMRRLFQDVAKIIEFLGAPINHKTYADFFGCLKEEAEKDHRLSGDKKTVISKKALRAFVELYQQDIQVAQLEKLLSEKGEGR